MSRLLLALTGLAVLIVASVDAQPVQTLARSGFNPVTENGRVIWTNGPDPDTQTLSLWDGQNTVELDQQVSVALAGWPDLDADGRVAYLKLVGGRYELMLWDGFETRQLTHNDDVDGSDVDLGTRTSELKGGFVRIAYGDIVFKSANSDVYVYDSVDLAIRQINTSREQRALKTTAEDRDVMQMTGIKPVFEFDGRTIIWRHQKQSGDQQSTFTLWRADADPNAATGWRIRKLTSFEASTPSGMNSIMAGLAADPNVVACGEDVAWTYRPPADIPADIPPQYRGYMALAQEVVLGAHDGDEAREITRGDLHPLALAVSGGTVAWIEFEDADSGDLTHIQSETDGRRRTIKTVPDPPGQAPAGSRHWRSPNGLFAHGSDVLWVEERVQCTPANLPGIPNGCLYMPPDEWGVFSSTAPARPQRMEPVGDFLLNGSFDQGRYAWRAFDNSIRTTMLIGGLADAGGLVQLVDQIADRVPLRPEEGRTRVVDGFSIRAAEGGGECAPGGDQAEGATISGLTLSLEAESGILADLSDIASLRVILDRDGDLKRGEGDRVLAEATDLSDRQSITFDQSVIVSPGDESVFIIEITMRDESEICPCNRYTISLAGEDVETGSVVVQGRSTGTLVLPPPTIERVWGDAQASLPGGRLEESLGIRVEGFPARCGQARFTLASASARNGALLLDEAEAEHTDLVLPFEEVEDGLEAEVGIRLGSEEGAYFVEATLELPESSACEPPVFTFVERAGTFVLQVVDANNPAFTEHTADTSHPDYNTWTVSMSSDPIALAVGGEERIGATADGASPLLLRARLLGFSEAPPGEVEFMVTADGDPGGLSPALGTTLPAASGSSTVSARWHGTPAGIVAFALYAPPSHFSDTSLDRLTMRFRATYELPESGEAVEKTQDTHLYRPPVLLTHGMWSAPGTWSEEFTTQDPRFDKYLVDYSDKAAWDFSTLGYVMRSEVAFALSQRRNRRIAAGKVDVVAHSMGGLITRQYISELQGASYRRPDNLGQGDIHRFITIGTPHHGSPMAWLAVQIRDTPATSDLAALATYYGGTDVHSGAVDSMCPGSPQLQQLGRTHVNAHTIRAWHLDSSADDFGWDTFYEYVDGIASLEDGRLELHQRSPKDLLIYSLKYAGMLTLETGVQGLYGSDKTDYLVTLGSQAGGIGQGQDTVFDHTLHIGVPSASVTDPRNGTTYQIHGETSRQSIMDHVVGLLHRAPDDRSVSGFAASLPPSIVEHTDIQCE
ncbi:MAG: hypothetical protein Rubg2KO_14650 [Rubricoccaceae bacterium]